MVCEPQILDFIVSDETVLELRPLQGLAQPEIVFHLAAEPLLRKSYLEPVATFDTNIMGTIKFFEACRKTASVKAIVNITSDKSCQNREWVWGIP